MDCDDLQRLGLTKDVEKQDLKLISEVKSAHMASHLYPIDPPEDV